MHVRIPSSLQDLHSSIELLCIWGNQLPFYFDILIVEPVLGWSPPMKPLRMSGIFLNWILEIMAPIDVHLVALTLPLHMEGISLKFELGDIDDPCILVTIFHFPEACGLYLSPSFRGVQCGWLWSIPNFLNLPLADVYLAINLISPPAVPHPHFRSPCIYNQICQLAHQLTPSLSTTSRLFPHCFSKISLSHFYTL